MFINRFFFSLSNSIEVYPQELDLLIRTGFIGSYTTFSTYGWDSFSLWQAKQKKLMIFYCLGSTLFGMIAVYVGIFICELFY